MHRYTNPADSNDDYTSWWPLSDNPYSYSPIRREAHEFYTLDDDMNICPSGYRVPKKSEFLNLYNAIVNSRPSGTNANTAFWNYDTIVRLTNADAGGGPCYWYQDHHYLTKHGEVECFQIFNDYNRKKVFEEHPSEQTKSIRCIKD